MSYGKYFKGDEEFSFGDLERSTHYFQRSKEHRPGGPNATILPIKIQAHQSSYTKPRSVIKNQRNS